MNVSNITLMKIASIGGVATVGMGYAFKIKISNNVKNTEYCKEALQTVRSHKAAIHLLGEPIKDKTIDVGNQNRNFTRETEARYEIPLAGPKQRGILYLWASRENDVSKWSVTRIELGLQNELERRLVIKSVDT